MLCAGRSFAWSGGQLIAITGASGSGKSSLLLALAGQLPVHAGTVEHGARARGDTAILHQDLLLVPRASVLDNACCGSLARLAWWRSWFGFPAEVRACARARLAELGIGHLERRWAASISGGERARAALARCLVQEPRLLLADEPVASLDDATAATVMERLRAQARAGALVVCALHQRPLVERYADAVLDLGAA